MNYERLWQRLTTIYDAGEAKAVVRMVLEMCFGLSMTEILCGKVEQMGEPEQQELESMMVRLEKAEPVQYVIGIADFCGRPFHVEPGVLIPRPETEELCQWIVSVQGGRWRTEEDHSILDVGTGSGCLAITLALELPRTKVTAWDISDKALRIAQENARRLNASVTFEHRDALHPLPITPFDLIVSNPPYISETERDGMAKNVLDYEPHEALFAPPNEPDLFYQRISDYAIQSLKSGGQLFFELNPLTATDVCHYLQHLGFEAIELRQDQFGKQRFLKATKI